MGGCPRPDTRTAVAVFVRSALAHEAIGRTRLDAGNRGCLVDRPRPAVHARGHEQLWHRRAVEAPVDEHCSARVGLSAEVVLLVVHHERVTEGAHRQVEVLWSDLGSGRGRVAGTRALAASNQRSEHPHDYSTGVLARAGQHEPEGKVRVLRGLSRSPGHGDDRRLERRGDLRALAALVVFELAVVLPRAHTSPRRDRSHKSPSVQTALGCEAGRQWHRDRPSRHNPTALQLRAPARSPRGGS